MPSDERPNVLFLLSDEHSFRCLSRRDDGHGEPVTTPRLDALANQGTSFERTYCQMPRCTPSRLCLLTGRDVRNCGAWDNSAVLPPDLSTLPGTLSNAGYATGLVGKMHLGGSRQFVGFDDRPYGDLTGGTGHQWEPLDRTGGLRIGERLDDAGVTEIPEGQLQEYNVTRESLAWIRERARGEAPWFCCASLSRPHFPLTAPRRFVERYWDVEADEPTDLVTDPPVGREGDASDHPMTVGAIEGFETADVDRHTTLRARAHYFACVDFLDAIVDEFLATLERDGLLENTVVVYASDHGELAGEHGLWWKQTWHEASARVPFLIQTPAHRDGSAPAADLRTPVSLGDLFPTVCGLAGVDAPADLDGTDLSDAVETGEEPDRDPVVCDNLVPRWGEGTEFRMVRDGRYKYVAFRDAPELLFDLDADPLETRNLAPGADREARDRLSAFVDETMDFEAAAREREANDLSERFALDADLPEGASNCYVVNGRVVSADSALYHPHVVVEDPSATFDDYPDDG